MKTRRLTLLRSAASLTGGLSLSLILSACEMAPPGELALISPELNKATDADRSTDLPPLTDVTEASDVSPIVIGTLRSQSGIASAASRVQSELSGIATEQAGFLPEVSAGLVTDLSPIDDATPRLQLTGSQMIYDFGRTGRAVSQQALRTQRAHLDFLDTVDEELTDMLNLVADYESQERRLALAEARLSRMQELRDLVEDRITAGAATNISLIDADRRVQTAQTLLLRAELGLASATRDINLETDTDIRTGALPQLDILRCGEMPLDPDSITSVKDAAIEIGMAELDLLDAQSARLPSIALQASTARDLNDLGQGGDIDLSLRLNTVIFQGGATQSRGAVARNNLLAAEANLTSARQRAERIHAAAVDAIASRRVLAEAISDQVSLLERTRDL